MNFNIFSEEEQKEAYELSGEISQNLLMLDFDAAFIKMESLKGIFDAHAYKIQQDLKNNESENFKKLIKEENGKEVLEIPNHLNRRYFPISRKEILKETEKAFGIKDLEATPEMVSESLKKYKSEPIKWIPKKGIIQYEGLLFVSSYFLQEEYIKKYTDKFIIKTFKI